jgi:hypothetical protein
MQSLGHPIGVIDAFILESLTSGVRAAALMVPGALGALEGSFILFGALFGLPGTRRWPFPCRSASELALGLPACWPGLDRRALSSAP